MIEFILTNVPGYGWLCKILEDGKEIYKGEFRASWAVAMYAAETWMEERNGQKITDNSTGKSHSSTQAGLVEVP